MRFLTWNIGNQTHEKKLPPEMADAIISLGPDLFVLTEFVDGLSREQFKKELGNAGYHIMVSPQKEEQNQILVASRRALAPGKITAPELKVKNRRGKELTATALPSNVLNVRITEPEISILGIRIPDYSNQPLLRKACWNWLLDIARTQRDEPTVILGDLNADPNPEFSPKYYCEYMGRLKKEGWNHALPAVGASFWTRLGNWEKRLDHAFFSRHFTIEKSEFRVEDGKHIFARTPGAMSDHAALVVDTKFV